MRRFLVVSLALVVLLTTAVALLPAPVSVPTASAATNTVLNPGFEEPSVGGTGAAPTSWTPATTAPFRGNSTSTFWEGSFSAYLHGTSGSYTQTVSIGADTTYRFEAYTRATSTATETVTLDIRNSSAVVLDTFTWNGTNHGWTRRETYLATPTNAWDAVITLSISGDSIAEAWFDSIVLVEDTASYCFIATAAFGSGSDSHVETLRGFRDRYMAPNSAGSALVATYYRISPPVARFIDDHPSLKPAVKAGLLPSIGLSSMAMSTTPVEKTAMAGAMLALSGLAVFCLRRRALAHRA